VVEEAWMARSQKRRIIAKIGELHFGRAMRMAKLS